MPTMVIIHDYFSHIAKPNYRKGTFQGFFLGFRLTLIMAFLVLQKADITDRWIGRIATESGFQGFRVDLNISGNKHSVAFCHFLAVFSWAQPLVDKGQLPFCKNIKLFLDLSIFSSVLLGGRDRFAFFIIPGVQFLGWFRNPGVFRGCSHVFLGCV